MHGQAHNPHRHDGLRKSTVAPIVAKKLMRPVIEVGRLDRRAGRHAHQRNFIAKGEAYFRRVESEMIARHHQANARGAFARRRGVPVGNDAPVAARPHRGVLSFGDARDTDLAAAIDHGAASSLERSRRQWQDTIRDLLGATRRLLRMAHYRVETDSHSPAEVAKSILMMREAYE